ncbi:MAG: Peptidyl-tRNA hydrolase [Microgenomates group bacterium GW2011_GWC1_41_20]|uniref:Peptidyl-tRNA hydrolase n=4 Tax=Candidatus Woeseibacteriota TaxID=1752722 RepID=A0A0G0VXD1_9BACT|nr:MAG: Peptidyl-tRNA hydrolase [Candidatus Woesebacteria bacterium GW2011_GWD1_41_12]KKR99781.1 MAG: Peptidyl-tRNA hydrolase [Microgenomates group bacterium GW2011_GWC1_41_20]KKS04352.1 MAG: Peptidyl-tRNA hydrolase [Candidatus Woesebacteria bacterium GW2011_GWE1_41_24]
MLHRIKEMKLIIGLGNPGVSYSETRHNIGHMVIDKLQLVKIPGAIIKKTGVFMNESGSFVKKLITDHKIPASALYVIHDDLDIPIGEYKIQFARGPKDHNGLKSIDENLGTDEYWHVRIGVDNRPSDNRPMGEEYVLQNFSDEEKVIIDRIIKEVCKKLETLLINTN